MGGTTRTITYTYDTARRLTREVDTGGGTTTRDYIFDTRGNRILMTVTGAQTYTVNYAYDLDNRLLAEGRRGVNQHTTRSTYDNNGNQLTSVTVFETETRTYNAFNQLTQVSRPGMTVDYTYRPDGLRLSKSMGNITTTHVWDGGHIVAERNQAGGVMNRFDRGAGQRVIRSEHHGFYLYNARGDVVQRANAAGVVTHSYRYTAFGNELAGNQSANEASTNPWRFASMYWDAHTQTYYTPNRRLNPRTGRWLSPDPFWNIRNMQRNTAAITQSGNLFMYTMHNPVRWTDPTGLFAMPPGFGAWWVPTPGIGGSSPIVNKVNMAVRAAANASSSAGSTSSSFGTTTSAQVPWISPLVSSWSFSGTPIKCTSPNPKKMDSLEGGGGGMGGVGGSKGGSNTGNWGGVGNSSGSRAGGVGTTAPKSPTGGTITGNNIVFGSATKPAERLERQMSQRGWSQDSVRHTVDNPHTTRASVNQGTGNPATVFYNRDGSHVIIDNITREVIQVSDMFGQWIPDSNIVDPFIPHQ